MFKLTQKFTHGSRISGGMAAVFLAKKATINLPKVQPYVDSATRISRGSSSVAETRGDGTGPDTSTNNDPGPVSQGICEAKQQGLDMDEHLRTGIADSAKEGVRKAIEVNKTVSNGGNGNYINHHKDDNHTEDNVLDEIHNIDGPVDTVEYRAIEENMEDLKKTGNTDGPVKYRVIEENIEDLKKTGNIAH